NEPLFAREDEKRAIARLERPIAVHGSISIASVGACDGKPVGPRPQWGAPGPSACRAGIGVRVAASSRALRSQRAACRAAPSLAGPKNQTSPQSRLAPARPRARE